MPTRPLSPCLHHGCAALVPRGYCAAHAKQSSKAQYDAGKRKDDPRLYAAAKFRSGGDWRKLERQHKAAYPLCCDPLGVHGNWPFPTDDSHHIEPLYRRIELGLTWANLAPLCKECHTRIEALERAGTATQHLFGQHQQSADSSMPVGIG